MKPVTMKSYIIASAINLSFLAIGLFVGLLYADLRSVVHAQTRLSPEQINTDRAFKWLAAVTFVSHQMVTDQAIAGGVDLVKLHENTLGLLSSKGVATSAEVEAAIDKARVKDMPVLRLENGVAVIKKGDQ
jgi:hypothetical protein